MYKVIKPCHLDRDYKIGELISNEMLDIKAAGRMMRLGYVTGIEDAQENVISGNIQGETEKQDTGVKEVYENRFEGLEDMTKEELLNLADQLEIDVKPNLNKAKIIEMIHACE